MAWGGMDVEFPFALIGSAADKSDKRRPSVRDFKRRQPFVHLHETDVEEPKMKTERPTTSRGEYTYFAAAFEARIGVKQKKMLWGSE